MTSNQQFSLKWTNYTNHITNAFDSLRSKEDFCDVTLCCEGRKIRAHKVLLSACSNYFKEIFKDNPCQHPVIIFKNVKYDDLLSIVVYMYQGEVNIEQESLPTFLHTAEMLSIQGLTEDDETQNKIDGQTQLSSAAAAAVAAVSKTIPMAIPSITKPILKDTRLRSASKAAITKPQSISLLNTPTVDQIVYTTIAPHPVSLIQSEAAPPKRKRIHKSDENNTITENVTTKNASQISDDQDGGENTSSVQYFKQDTELDITDEYDNNRADDDDEMFESGSQEEGKETADDYEKPNIATQAELGRLFSSDAQSDGKRQSGGQNTDAPTSKWSQCQFCKLVITTVNLWRHIRTQHTAQPPRQCEHCQKKFKNKYSLREHVRIAHEQKSPTS